MLAELIRQKAKTCRGPEGKEYAALFLKEIREIGAFCQVAAKEVEITALELGVIPEKYQRSMGSVGGAAGQLMLLKSRVAVLGAGGLGGTVVELAARMGFGTLVVLDGDVFSDSNLNRQLLATEKNAGKSKAEEAAARAANINSAVRVIPYSCYATRDNLAEKIAGCDVVIDCLDNLPSRFIAEAVAKELGIPLVHGAIAHHLGQITTIFPEDPGLSLIYGKLPPDQEKGIEKELGNPATTPAVIAALEVQEAMKIILKRKSILRNRLLLIDIENGTMETLKLT